MPTIAIVGASRGIGREFARQYLKDGWTVYATARRDEDLDALAAAGARTARADVTDEASLKGFAEILPDGLDVLVVNAGISSDKFELTIEDVDADAWLSVMRVNALGPVLAARAIAGKLLRPGGKLVVVTSMMGSIGDNQGGGFWSYRMSKAAANMAVKNLSNALRGDGIVAAALHPGWVKTDMGGPQAQVEPADSVTGMRRVIAGLVPGDTRHFIDYQGKELPW